MQHEILLAMVGLTGDVIVLEGDEDKYRRGATFRVNSMLPEAFISKADRQLVNGIVRTGWHFKRVNRFVRESAEVKRACPRFGLYKRALAVGLDQILDEYREAISAAEARFIQDEALSLLEIRHSLADYIDMLPVLSATVEAIEEREISGLQISDFLFLQSCLGSPNAKRCFGRLLQHCHRVMFNQVISWILHGEIVDHYGEFFVEERRLADGGRTLYAAASRAFHDIVGGEEDDDSRGGGSRRDSVVNEYEWDMRHSLRLTMLPRSFLPSRLAEKVLFVGKAVHILRRSAHDRFGRTRKMNFRHRRQECDEFLSDDDDDDNDENVFSASGIWGSRDREREFAATLLKLRDDKQLNIMDLEYAVDRIQNVVATRLLQLIFDKNEGALERHLGVLRDTFLLGDGHFFSVFIEASQDLMCRPVGRQSERDVNLGPWRQACAMSELDDLRRRHLPGMRLDLSEFAFSTFSSRDFGLVVPDAVATGAFSGTPSSSYEGEFDSLDAQGVFGGLASSSSSSWTSPPLRLLGSAALHRIDVGGDATLSAAAAGASSRNDRAEGATSEKCCVLLGTPPDRLEDPFLAGAMWTVNKKRVCSGFDMSCEFKAGEGARGFAFVVQNHRALASGNQEARSIGCRIPRSVAVVVDFGRGDVGSDAEEDEEKGNEIVVSIRVPESATSTTTSKRPGRSVDVVESDDSESSKSIATLHGRNRPRRLRVRYAPHETTRHRWSLTVYLDDDGKPIVSKTMDMASAIGDACGNGRGWIGFTGSARPSASDDSEDVLQLLSWRFSRLAAAGTEEKDMQTQASYRSAAEKVRRKMGEIADAWRQLSLSYRVPWPLHLVITQRDLEQYNALFCFLFTTKRVGAALDRAWVSLNATKYRLGGGLWKKRRCRRDDGNSSTTPSGGGVVSERFDEFGRRHLLRLQLLRRTMAFFIDNLQYYLQVDVVEAAVSRMQRSLTKAKLSTRSSPRGDGDKENDDGAAATAVSLGGTASPSKTSTTRAVAAGGAISAFRSVQRAHKEFLTTLARRTFIQVKAIRAVLYDILGVCLDFCALVNTHSEDVTKLPVTHFRSVERSFEQLSTLMIMLLRRSSSHQALLLRLTFNDFFDGRSMGPMAGSVPRRR